MISRTARKALRAKRQGKAKTVSGIPLDDPWLAGDQARHDGLAETDNPFPAGTEDSDDWLIGYRESKAKNTRSRRW